MSSPTDILFSLFAFPKPSKIQYVHILPSDKNITRNIYWLCGAPHREHSEFVCGCWGSQRGGEVGAIWAVPCQTRMKQDHPGWRQELGMGSGKLVGGPAGSPSPGLRQQAAAGTLRPCQSGRSPQRPLQPPSSITQQSHSDRGCVCMQKWGGYVCWVEFGESWRRYF